MPLGFACLAGSLGQGADTVCVVCGEGPVCKSLCVKGESVAKRRCVRSDCVQ